MARRDRRATIRRMAVIACDACGGKMNDGLAVCPHCGARRALAGRPKLSGDEIRALLATDPTARDGEPRGLMQALILPHPATRGAARAAEIALTLVGLPIVLSSAVAIALTRRARRAVAAGGELPAALTMTVFCGPGLFLAPGWLVGASIAAIWLRALIRSRSAGRRGVDLHRDLHRIERPAPERPALEPAPGEPAEPPRPPEAPAQASSEPHLLR
jgi:DNA-directed RNA polymerase subunit RPC12/RpoP